LGEGEVGKGRWKTHYESLVYFDGFVRRGGDRVFVNIFEIRGAEIFGKGGRYDFGSETLNESDDVKTTAFLKGPMKRTKI
jgi:hypothetical protein